MQREGGWNLVQGDAHTCEHCQLTLSHPPFPSSFRPPCQSHMGRGNDRRARQAAGDAAKGERGCSGSLQPRRGIMSSSPLQSPILTQIDEPPTPYHASYEPADSEDDGSRRRTYLLCLLSLSYLLCPPPASHHPTPPTHPALSFVTQPPAPTPSARAPARPARRPSPATWRSTGTC